MHIKLLGFTLREMVIIFPTRELDNGNTESIYVHGPDNINCSFVVTARLLVQNSIKNLGFWSRPASPKIQQRNGSAAMWFVSQRAANSDQVILHSRPNPHVAPRANAEGNGGYNFLASWRWSFAETLEKRYGWWKGDKLHGDEKREMMDYLT